MDFLRVCGSVDGQQKSLDPALPDTVVVARFPPCPSTRKAETKALRRGRRLPRLRCAPQPEWAGIPQPSAARATMKGDGRLCPRNREERPGGDVTCRTRGTTRRAPNAARGDFSAVSPRFPERYSQTAPVEENVLRAGAPRHSRGTAGAWGFTPFFPMRAIPAMPGRRRSCCRSEKRGDGYGRGSRVQAPGFRRRGQG